MLKKIKLLHCGDLHLDAPFASLADREGLPDKRRQELKKTLASIVDLALEEQVDLLLICGDLYEHGYVKKSTFHFLCDQFNRISDMPVLIIPGNHDPAVPDSLYSSQEWPENVHILKDGNAAFEHAATGTRVYGVKPASPLPRQPGLSAHAGTQGVEGIGPIGGFDPFRGTSPTRGTDPIAGADPAGITGSMRGPVDASRLLMENGAAFHILMLHGTLDMPFSSDAFQPVASMELDTLGFDYCALGHFHTMIRGAGRQGRIFNAGSPEPLGFDEEGEHGVFLVTIVRTDDGKSHVDTDFRKLAQRRFFHLTVNAGDCLSDEQTAAVVASALEPAGKPFDFYRVTLQGYRNHAYKADAAYIQDLLKDKAGFLKIVDNTVPDYDFGRISKEPGLRGLFVRKMLERAAASGDEESERLVMSALYFGMEAIDGGSVCV